MALSTQIVCLPVQIMGQNCRFKTGIRATQVPTCYLAGANDKGSFIGSGFFCIKACDPTVTTPDYCQKFVCSICYCSYRLRRRLNIIYSIYDLIGCTYNMPASYVSGEFTSCEGDLQDEVGTYTSNGQSEASVFSRHQYKCIHAR